MTNKDAINPKAPIKIQVKKFPPEYKEVDQETKDLFDNIHSKAKELEELFKKTGTGQYKELAVTKLEECVEWSMKEIASKEYL